MSTHRWWFDPGDTWFFRESRPHGAAGASELSSLFPPPARTVAGAVRTLIGEAVDVNWAAFARGQAQLPSLPDITLRDEIGSPTSFGRLRLRGPFPVQSGAMLYPAPLALLRGGRELVRLRPGPAIRCDLGQVRLPVLSSPLPGAKVVEGCYLSAFGINSFLGGESPTGLVQEESLFSREPRLGIARDNGRRTAADGMLYQTRHIRPHYDSGSELSIAIDVGGIDKRLQPAGGTIRFGGEGRPAGVTVEPLDGTGKHEVLPFGGKNEVGAQGFVLVLLTHGDFSANGLCDWIPPGFTAAEENGQRVWNGTLAGIDLTIETAVLGRPVREGGWDMANQAPRAVTSLVPAGSVYFCRCPGALADAASALHGAHIGNDTELGRGELAVGLWKE